jgi:2'-deoxynucleoside 5'-phosphate N-hydrolase
MKAYIAVNFNKRKLLEKEIKAIVNLLEAFNISSIVFVDNYTFALTEEQQMMEQAMKTINSCDILIAETSYKAIGVGIEVGYAKAIGKTVIYLRQKEKEHSTTVSGISDFQIVYIDVDDLKKQLTAIINKIKISI